MSGECGKKHTIDYHSALRMEIVPFAMIGQRRNVLSEISQTQDKYHITPLL
jgi:hypothetical protein